MGLSDLTLGYDPLSSAQTPSMQGALERSLEQARRLPGAVVTEQGQVAGSHLNPEAVVTSYREIVELFAGVARQAAGETTE